MKRVKTKNGHIIHICLSVVLCQPSSLTLNADQQLAFSYSTILSSQTLWTERMWGEGWHSRSPPYFPVPLAQFFLVLAFTEDDDWASQPHSTALPVSLAELFVCTNLPPTAHCAKLMFHPHHIDHANVQGKCVHLTPERWWESEKNKWWAPVSLAKNERHLIHWQTLMRVHIWKKK